MSDDHQRDRYRSLRHVQASVPDFSDSTSTLQPDPFNGGDKTKETLSVNSKPLWSSVNLPPTLQWIPANWSWSKWKPVLRSALVAWICLVLFLIPTTLNLMGQAAFLIIIASFLLPPSEPFIVMLQRELSILIFAASGWAWSCLGIKVAYIARSTKDPTASLADIMAGQYIEPIPTIIMAVFLFIGSFVFMYIKSRMPPGPLTFAYLFSCMLCMDMSLTIAALYPYPYYTIGGIVVLPLVIHGAVSLILSLCFFPTAGSATFITRLQDVLSSLASATKEHRQRLQQDVTASDFTASPIVTAVRKAEGALAVLSSAVRLLKFDIIYSRFAPTDYTRLHSLTRGLIVKAGGMSAYHTLINPTRESCPFTRVTSIAATPAFTSPSPSRPQSPGHEQQLANIEKVNGGATRHPYHRYHDTTHPHPRRRVPLRQTPFHHSTLSQSSLPHSELSRARRMESPVGVFECLHYLNLEATHLYPPESEAHAARANELLSNSCHDLLQSCEHGLEGVCDWLNSVRTNFFDPWMSRREEERRTRTDRIKKYEDLYHKLSLNLNEFIDNKRFTVLDPYRVMFTSADDTMMEPEVPSHRHLFHCYVYQYHLMQFAKSVQDMLSEIIRLETEREAPRVWFPKIHWYQTWEGPSEMMENDDDENPDMVPGMEPASLTDLGQAVRRDPDALPPRNALERSANWLYHLAKKIGGGNFLFALKAAILTILLSLPSFFGSSAAFANENKFAWAVVMAQLTGSRFRGDTTFGFIARIFSTFVGGLIAAVVWYVSAGTGKGNPFGLAAVCFVCFPLFFFFRLYWPGAPMINLIIWVTAALVLGYSYEDTHLALTSSPGYGIAIAWKRMVLVIAGVFAAGIFSFLPPVMTIRLYERKALATTIANIGSVYCSIISFANTRREGETAVIDQHLLAILNKLKRSIMLKENAVYEFSLRGKWPAERYHRILELQIQISNLLSHLTSVSEQMEPAWAHAFLRRTRLSDADFQGDVLAVISLISSSLRTGDPLPQVTPCPLLNRFIDHRHGLNIVHEESEEDFGLPKLLTEETLESLQYMNFCVGVSITYSIVIRLDQLMRAVKELVGEQYHIVGLGLPLHYRRARGVEMLSPAMTLTESNTS
ncbi:hypothetical protein EV363DRAFT_907034 [Boletus edulis]|nr:hypothetical protein EV363DRAFT_907034 [Boletus edulis]